MVLDGKNASEPDPRRWWALVRHHQRDGLHPHALRPAGAWLLGARVRHQLRDHAGCGRCRHDRRSGGDPEGRLPGGRRDGHGADRCGVASGLSNSAFQVGIALGVAIVTTVAVSRSEDYLAANEGANPLIVLTEGFQSAFLACGVLAAIGVALALLLPGRPRAVAQERVELAPRLAVLKRLAEESRV